MEASWADSTMSRSPPNCPPKKTCTSNSPLLRSFIHLANSCAAFSEEPPAGLMLTPRATLAFPPAAGAAAAGADVAAAGAEAGFVAWAAGRAVGAAPGADDPQAAAKPLSAATPDRAPTALR